MTISDSTNITAPRVPFLDDAGLISRPWFMWLLNMFAQANTGSTDIAKLNTEITLAPKSVFFAGTDGKPVGDPLLQFDLTGHQLIVGTIVDIGDFIQLTEETEPAAPAANKVRIYAQDDGTGKTQLMAKFATGAAQQLAIQP